MKDPAIATFVIPKVPCSLNQITRKNGRALYRNDKNAWRDYFTVLKTRRRGTPLWWEQKKENPIRPVALHLIACGWQSRDVDRLCWQPLIDSMGSRKVYFFGRTGNKRVQQTWRGVGILVDDRCELVRPILSDYIKIPRTVQRRTIVRILPQDCFMIDPFIPSPALLGMDPAFEFPGS